LVKKVVVKLYSILVIWIVRSRGPRLQSRGPGPPP